MTPTITRSIRLVAMLAAALLAGSAWVAAQQAAGSETGSPGAVVAAVLAGLAAIGCLLVATAPAKRLLCLWNIFDVVQRRLARPPAAISETVATVVGMIGVTGFAAIVGRLLSQPQDPWDDDQGAFLITAREIQAQGGIAWLWSALWSGEFAEANRHPLYLALLSLRPSVQAGQYLSAAIGALTLLLLVAVSVRRCGRPAAVLLCVLLGTNGAFCLFSTRVVCDVLLVLWCGLVWLIHLPPTPDSVISRVSAMRCASGGALLGLAWLTKGTGLVLLAGYLAWVALATLWPTNSHVETSATANNVSTRWRRSSVAGRCLLCALAAFLFVGAPLIARNVARFGNPFHNVNSLLLFADRYEDLLDMLDRQLTTGAAAREYLAAHTVADVVHREAGGLVWEAYIIVRSLGPAPLDDARVLFGVPLALLALLRMAARRSAADGLLLIWGGICWAMFAWYVPIAAGERFILPLLAPALMLASEALCRVKAGENRGWSRWLPGLAAGWCALWVFASWVTTGWSERNG